MAEFFVTNESHADAKHKVHNKLCEHLPAKDTLRYLGSYGNKEAAYTKAKGIYSIVEFCKSCIK